MEVLWFLLCTHIPYEEIKYKKKSHLWINEECEESIALKNVVEDTVEYEQRRSECHQGLSGHHKKYLSELTATIVELKKGNKIWWRLNRELLEKKTKSSSSPPL